MIYPWQESMWRKVSGMRNRMPHALLLQGPRGTGKLDFARTLAASLLCERKPPDAHPCGQCDSCNWFGQESHPDFRLVEPLGSEPSNEEGDNASAKTKKQWISVDQVRELADFLGLSSHRPGGRVVLIHPAETLNAASANALLKMLEEPPAGVIFLLVTHQSQRLLPTIRSRCSKLAMPVPDQATALDWLVEQGVSAPEQTLAFYGNAPLLAVGQASEAHARWQDFQRQLACGHRLDPFATAAIGAADGMEHTLMRLQKWTYDLLSLASANIVRYHIASRESLQALAKAVDLPRLLDFQRMLLEHARYVAHPLNTELQLEAILVQYTQLFVIRP